MFMNESSKALDEFYDYVKGSETSDTPVCEVSISVGEETGICAIMVTKEKGYSVLYISFNDNIVSSLRGSVFCSAKIHFTYIDGTLQFTTKQDQEVKIRKI